MIFYDQNKDVWQLFDHEGKVIILDFSTVWCGLVRMQVILYNLFKMITGKIEFVTVLIEGMTGAPPTEEEINEWVTSMG